MSDSRGGLREAQDVPGPASRPARPSLQEGESPSATSDDVFPADIKVNGRELTVEEHYRIARMPLAQVRREYAVRRAAEFVARVKAAIKHWDGVTL